METVTVFNPMVWAIRPLLEKAISEDVQFAQRVLITTSRQEKKKTLQECCEYILGEAFAYAKEHKQGQIGMAMMPDDEMMGMIKHYFDEDDIKIQRVDNHVQVCAPRPETEEEKAERLAREEKMRKDREEAQKKAEEEKKRKEMEKRAKKNLDCGDLFGGMDQESEKEAGDNQEGEEGDEEEIEAEEE